MDLVDFGSGKEWTDRFRAIGVSDNVIQKIDSDNLSESEVRYIFDVLKMVMNPIVEESELLNESISDAVGKAEYINGIVDGMEDTPERAAVHLNEISESMTKIIDEAKAYLEAFPYSFGETPEKAAIYFQSLESDIENVVINAREYVRGLIEGVGDDSVELQININKFSDDMESTLIEAKKYLANASEYLQ